MRRAKDKERKAKQSIDPEVAAAVQLITEQGLSDAWVMASLRPRVPSYNRREKILRQAHERIKEDDKPEPPAVRRARLRAAIVEAYEDDDREQACRFGDKLAELVDCGVYLPENRSADELQKSILDAMRLRRSGEMTESQYRDHVKAIQAMGAIGAKQRRGRR